MRGTFFRESSRLSLSFLKASMSGFLARRMSFAPRPSELVRTVQLVLPPARRGAGLESGGAGLGPADALERVATLDSTTGPGARTATVTTSSDFSLRMWAAFLRAAI